RDESMFNHRPFLVLADHLTNHGIAVLRWDDRGVGGSEGDFSTATSRDFAADAEAAFEYLRRRPEVASDAVGLAGHSEGGIVAGMVAARRSDVAFLILLAGPGLPGEEILYMQGRAIGRAMGASEDAIRLNYEIQRATFDVLRTEPDPARARAGVEEVLRRIFDETTPAERAPLGIPAGAEEAWVQAQLAAVTSPWFRFFLGYDPRDDLRRIDPSVPVLAMIGDRDLQVPAEPNLAAIREAMDRHADRLTTIVQPGLNHLFQTAATGTPAEYALIDETFSPVAMDAIATWIRTVTAAPR
ncbi:MAG TPA: alpha/beta hydrolase, partial [Longimicrobiales bacterium]|nr:alpha/beta hydrolase [Longimicrobiales bacterium]